MGCKHFPQLSIVCMGVSITNLVPQTNLYQALSEIIRDDPKLNQMPYFLSIFENCSEMS